MATYPTIGEQPNWHVLLASRAWQNLRPQQKTWLVSFISTGDLLASTRAAYPKASDSSQRVMSYQISVSPRIRAALAVWQGQANRAQRIAVLEEQLLATTPGTREAVVMTAKLDRLVAEDSQA